MKTLKLLATLRDVAGTKDITVPFENGQTVRDLILSIQGINPELGAAIVDTDGQLTGLVNILVQGRNTVWLQGLDTVIKDSDTVVLLPPAAGG